MRDGLRAGRFTRSRLVNYRADGTAYWVDVHLSPVRDAQGRLTRYVAVQHDVTGEVHAQLAAAHAANRDGLTGLMNRAAFTAALTREISRAQRRGTSVGVMFLDVDDFKGVNDRYGHVVGDGYLVHVAECLRQRLRGDDAAARIGGDEFIALVTDLPGDGTAAAARVVDDLSAALARPFAIDGVEHRISVAVGTALHPRDGATVRELVAAADAHMYVHKARRTHDIGPRPRDLGREAP
jgi:diguanylate cyclase (GGDEF)-like protein